MTALLAGGGLVSVTHCDNGGETSSGGGESAGARFPTSGSSGQAGEAGTPGTGGVAGGAGTAVANAGKAGGSCIPPTTATVCRTLEQLADCRGGGGEGGLGGQAGDGGLAGDGSQAGEGGLAGDAGSGAGTTAQRQANPCPYAANVRSCVSFPFMMSGPTWNGTECCYSGTTCKGLAFTVGHAARVAHGVERADWSVVSGTGGSSEDSSEVAEALAQGWLEDALAEHASVASFARLTLELLALGAPSALVERAQSAALDEIRHARLCFALSARYSGLAVGPSPLDVGGALESIDLEELAVRTLRDGCMGETVAALIVAEQSEAAQDPELARALRGIADDEARHAELAWSLLRWALDVGGSPVRAAVAQAFEATFAQLSRGGELSGQALNLRAHGRLAAADIASVTARALSEVVAPCARVLLSPIPAPVRNAGVLWSASG